MADTLTFELVSPEKLLVSKAVSLVTVPGGEGDYGVLPGHAPLITTVRPGVIDMYDDPNGHPTARMFVSGGFAEVTPQRCTVLADEAIPVAELNRLEIEDAIKATVDKVAGADAETRAALEAKLEVLTAKLDVVAA